MLSFNIIGLRNNWINEYTDLISFTKAIICTSLVVGDSFQKKKGNTTNQLDLHELKWYINFFKRKGDGRMMKGAILEQAHVLPKGMYPRAYKSKL